MGSVNPRLRLYQKSIHGPGLSTLPIPAVCPSHGMDLCDYAQLTIRVIDLFFYVLTPRRFPFFTTHSVRHKRGGYYGQTAYDKKGVVVKY